MTPADKHLGPRARTAGLAWVEPKKRRVKTRKVLIATPRRTVPKKINFDTDPRRATRIITAHAGTIEQTTIDFNKLKVLFDGLDSQYDDFTIPDIQAYDVSYLDDDTEESTEP